jgi:hypothetical protein
MDRAMIEKESVEKSGHVRVTFELPSALWADRVNLVGEFNDWDTTATPMTRDRRHRDWRVTVELSAGRRYLFRYLLDGQEWVNEWHATGNVEEDLLSITAVHPMREDAVREFLARAMTGWSVVDGLIARGHLIEMEYQGQRFYMRKLGAQMLKSETGRWRDRDL